MISLVRDCFTFLRLIWRFWNFPPRDSSPYFSKPRSLSSALLRLFHSVSFPPSLFHNVSFPLSLFHNVSFSLSLFHNVSFPLISTSVYQLRSWSLHSVQSTAASIFSAAAHGNFNYFHLEQCNPAHVHLDIHSAVTPQRLIYSSSSSCATLRLIVD